MQTFELPESGVKINSLGFSPDGRLLAAESSGKVFVIDTAASTARTICPTYDEVGSGAAGVGFTADGTGVIALHGAWVRATPTSWVAVHDAETGEERARFPGPRARALAVGADGLAYLSCYGTEGISFVRWDPLAKERKTLFARTVGFVQELAVSPSNRWAVESMEGEVRLWSLGQAKPPTRATRVLRLPKKVGLIALAVSDNGHVAVACGAENAADRGVRVWSPGSKRATRVRDSAPLAGRRLAFHPSRPLLAYTGGDREVIFWDAEAGVEVRRFAWGIGSMWATAFSPDGLRCAAGGLSKVVIWDVDE